MPVINVGKSNMDPEQMLEASDEISSGNETYGLENWRKK